VTGSGSFLKRAKFIGIAHKKNIFNPSVLDRKNLTRYDLIFLVVKQSWLMIYETWQYLNISIKFVEQSLQKANDMFPS
jgi:hypothetical protein